jgi:hypothetical protein
VRRWVLGAHAREQAESTSLARAEKLNRMKQAVTYNCQKILTKNFSRSINPACFNARIVYFSGSSYEKRSIRTIPGDNRIERLECGKTVDRITAAAHCRQLSKPQ